MVLDEGHKAKGLIVKVVDEQDESSGSSVGLAVETLQKMLPHARFVFATATIGTTPNDLRYVQRIGLWDEEAGFGGSTAMQFFIQR